MQTGRIVIYTGAKEITSDNIIPVLREAILEHNINSNRMQFLLDYDAGVQPIIRKNANLCVRGSLLSALVKNLWQFGHIIDLSLFI